MSRELGDLIELAGLGPDEQSRLRRVHELLVAAGPPAELPRALLPSRPELRARQRVRRPRSCRSPPGGGGAPLLAAAAVAAACFGSGYLIADQTHRAAVSVVQVVSLQGSSERDSFASLSVGSADPGGNLPLQLTVSGLPALSTPERPLRAHGLAARPSERVRGHVQGRPRRSDDGQLQRSLRGLEGDALRRHRARARNPSPATSS